MPEWKQVLTVKSLEVAEDIAARWSHYRPDVAAAYLRGYNRRRYIEEDAVKNQRGKYASES